MFGQTTIDAASIIDKANARIAAGAEILCGTKPSSNWREDPPGSGRIFCDTTDGSFLVMDLTKASAPRPAKMQPPRKVAVMSQFVCDPEDELAPSPPLPQEMWHDGPPPVRGDGALVVVILKPEAEMCAAYEHYGHPVIVHCWEVKLKTTVNPLRLEYADVLRWSEWKARTLQPPQPSPVTPFVDSVAPRH